MSYVLLTLLGFRIRQRDRQGRYQTASDMANNAGLPPKARQAGKIGALAEALKVPKDTLATETVAADQPPPASTPNQRKAFMDNRIQARRAPEETRGVERH